MVELSAHAMPVPVEASESKFSVSGVPSAVILPPFVRAEDGRVSVRIPRPRQIAATVINRVIGRKRIADWKDIDEPSRCDYLRARFLYLCLWRRLKRVVRVRLSPFSLCLPTEADTFTNHRQGLASGIRRICIVRLKNMGARTRPTSPCSKAV